VGWAASCRRQGSDVAARHLNTTLSCLLFGCHGRRGVEAFWIGPMATAKVYQNLVNLVIIP
jgi:hypothetical protein